ncbi:hypothetical protein PTNB29_07113 [Pyrenophora teres f. teres]|nr:hypothetical protein PTNB29_07113 [Pyrenophora teres f. teres]
MGINIDQCARDFASNGTQQDLWGWKGPIVGVTRNHTMQISREGCLHLCGTGYNAYPWKDISGVITTWILPVIGTLLQAPFESNSAWRTLLAITRWVGSPIASLSYVLWNIKVSAKAALMVDMAVRYDETPGRETHFGSMRDSMYLLLVMNQYTLTPTARLRELQKGAEGLLRITLFGKDLKLVGTSSGKTLREKRRKLAREVREMRRRGAVPVFVSIMWFLFAFALSIQDSFIHLGANSTAHDLALGCLLAWFPILILGSIVDRNPIAADVIRKKLSKLVDQVHRSLRDSENRDKFISTFKDQSDYPELKLWIEKIANVDEHLYSQMHDFFVEFAGQARVRWHYGAAHAILSDIENCYVADKGRNWLANEHEARASLVLGPINDDGLVWFDLREFWQIWTAIIIVGGSCGGAFILSYFTPTVGLGCRSGGYTIFFSVSLGLLIVEMTVWLFFSAACVEPALIKRTASRIRRYSSTFSQQDNRLMKEWKKLRHRVLWVLRTIGNYFLIGVVSVTHLLTPWRDRHSFDNGIQSDVENLKCYWSDMTPQTKWDLFFFRPVETFNTIWLIYIVLAQMLGWYRTCECITSHWAGGGGYVDFTAQDTAGPWVAPYWTTGAVLTSTVMGGSMFYITVEWCQQSFLSTEKYGEAMAGLRRTRRWRRGMAWVRWGVGGVVGVVGWMGRGIERMALKCGLVKTVQKTLVWSKGEEGVGTERVAATTTIAPAELMHYTPNFNSNSNHNDNTTWNPIHQPSPFVECTLSPPTPGISHRRNESDASSNPLDPLTLPPRPSEDSSSPLIRVPSQAVVQSEGDARGSNEARSGSKV